MYLRILKNHINNNSINKEVIEDIFAEVIIIFTESPKEISTELDRINAKFLDLYEGFAIVTIKIRDIEKLKDINSIEAIEPPKSLFYRIENGRNNSIHYEEEFEKIENEYEDNKYNLNGNGVLIGFVDSGIDFTHPAFKNFNNKTRIKNIYNIVENKVYDEDYINRALLKENPFEFLDERDLIGHGTNVASVASAGGLIPREFYGVASESTILMAKVGKEGVFYNSWQVQIMKGIKFLVHRAKELKMPLVINLSLNSNSADFLNEYLNRIGSLNNITIVSSVGNNGNREKHFRGLFSSNHKICWNVAVGEQGILMTLIKGRKDNVDIKINFPKGNFIKFNSKNDYKCFFVDEVKIAVYREFHQFDKELEYVKIFFESKEEYISDGTWSIEFFSRELFKDEFDLWFPISRSINEETRFFNGTREDTIVSPAVSQGVIAVGSCGEDYVLSDFSSIGREMEYSEVKPNIISKGESRLVASGNWFTYKSGTSLSAAEVSGIAALLMEWGIVRGHDRDLYGSKLKYYIQLGAIRSKFTKYPNIEQGYGVISFQETMRLLENI
ncbi:S8 family serine peptidase [Clostridium massiliamazoniense]|uniref:S8 family serine peptidase n=1 Tax=Clostridium massiliamazoniense TaxID=1347366 RepID=UPI0006D7CC18|nr:S8 family serine peptidase [Clostridium massiliamazoniense]